MILHGWPHDGRLYLRHTEDKVDGTTLVAYVKEEPRTEEDVFIPEWFFQSVEERENSATSEISLSGGGQGESPRQRLWLTPRIT